MTINRGVSKNSQYVFNSESGMLERIEDNVQTIESLSNAINNDDIKSLDDIGKEVNKLDKQEPVNNITIITADDNLIHNYFTFVEVSWDASNCLSSAIIKAPKINATNTNYWATYSGQLTIYAGYNFTFDYVNKNSYNNEKDAAKSLTKYWDNSKILPFFRGEISRVKETETSIIIYVDSIGIRFQQKIPDEFRQAYINNQNVRDAFQAICEFLGVKYICPPKTSTENSEEEVEDENAETDGTENDIASQEKKIKNTQKTVQKKVKSSNKKKTSTTNSNKNKTFTTNNNENKTFITNQTNNSKGSQSITLPNGETVTGDEESSEEDTELTNNEEIDEPQNGYGDITFDANGAIMHGSKTIETSPDMAETLLIMDENPLEKYLEDETGIIESVQKLLNGEMFDELHNQVMNYDAITIAPQASSTSEISATSDTTLISGSSSGDSSNAQGNANTLISNNSKTTGQSNRKTGARAGNRTGGNYNSKVNTNRVDNTMVTSRRDNTMLR